MRRLRPVALAAVVTLLAAVIAAATGGSAGGRGLARAALGGPRATAVRGVAPDSLAPPGAPHNWLPREGWVWMHWVPFEEPELAAALGTDAAGIRAYLADDRHVLAVLALRRGWHVWSLARYLTRRFDGRVTGLRLGALRWRAVRMLTQGHLAQHVLFHTFHGPAIPAHAEQLFGLSPSAFVAARQAGATPSELALRRGVTLAAVRSGVLRILTREAAEGVRTRSQTPAQSKRMLARQRRDLGCWMTTPLPKLDPNNPFGGRNGDAGQPPGHAQPPAIPGCDGMAMTASVGPSGRRSPP